MGSAPEGAGPGETGITGTASAGGGHPDEVVLSLTPIPGPRTSGGQGPGSTRLRLSSPFSGPAVSAARVECSRARDGAGFEAGILDLAGRVVRRLNPGTRAARAVSLAWDLRDDGGRRVRPGVYFLRVAAGGEHRTVRLVVSDSP